jgi:hypothetical protein
VSGLDPNLPVNNVQTMEEVVSASVGQPRLLSALSGLFGVLAGLLAMVGVYGVTSYNVRRQRRAASDWRWAPIPARCDGWSCAVAG